MSQGFLPFDTSPEKDARRRRADGSTPAEPGQAESPLPALFATPRDSGPEAEPPGGSPTRADDARARDRVQSVFDRPLVLEAGAGTGKTATLVARIVAWSTGPGWERARAHLGPEADAQRVAARVLSRVTSITFTEAAAADMADRVARGLATIGHGNFPPGLRAEFLPAEELRIERARALSVALEQLEVSTIHAYCRRLLGEAPFEARLHPAFEVDPEFEQCARVTREVLERELHAAWEQEGQHEHLLLAAEGLGPAQLEELLFELVINGTPVAALVQDPLAPERFQPRFAALAEELDALLALLRPMSGEVRRNSKLLETAERCEQARASLDLAPAIDGADVTPLEDLHALLAEAREEVHPRLAKWAKGDLTKEEDKALDACSARAEDLGQAAARVDARLGHLASIRPRLLRAQCAALAPLLEAVYETLRARGVETFDGLLQKTARLLAEHPEITARIRARTDLLCVDEFQDTDRLQYEILTHLALDELPVEAPALFLVGDPKQSIYGWRNADLAAYDGFVERVRRAGGEVHELVVNFRSLPPILDEVERVLAGTMVRREGIQPAFSSLLPCEAKLARAQETLPGPDAAASDGGGPASGALASVEYWVSWNLDDAGELDAHRGRASELEAQALAAQLSVLGQRPGFEWRHAALLLRSMTDLDVYLGALREAGVPYVVERDRNYYRRREIVEVVAWLNAVLRPHDTLSLVSFLRSVHVGVPDAAWIPLWAQGFPAAVAALQSGEGDALAGVETRVRAAAADLAGEGLEQLRGLEGWVDNLLEALSVLGRLRRTFRTESVGSFVALLRDGLALETTESARFLGAFRAANLDRFFRDLESRLEAENGDHHTVLRSLNRDVHLKQEATEARPKDSVEDAVRVMTFHMSKGLDFRHVYLGQLHKDLRPPRFDEDVTWEFVDGHFEFCLRGARSYGFDRIEERRSAVEYAERLRLLYVAMTRAEERLVLMGAWPTSARRDGPERSRALIDLVALRDPAPPELRALAVDLRDEERCSRTLDGTAWVFPGLEPSGETGVRATPASALPAVAELERATRDWSTRAEAARRRESRPWALAATELEGEPAPASAGAPTSSLPPALARAVGTAVHRELEWLGEVDPSGERERLTRAMRAELSDAALERALEAAEQLLTRFRAGPLAARFDEIREHVLARELAVWLPAPAGDETPAAPGDAPTQPVGYVSGRVDLVYRDPASGEIVIADYKTDDLPDAAACAARAEGYRAQAEVYLTALQQGLGLETRPRVEFWFLAQDLVFELPASGPG